MTADTIEIIDKRQRESLLWILSAATFMIFFQAFMVAPLIPRLAAFFAVSVETMGLVVPAYLIPYGLSTLVYGPLSDRFGRGKIIFASLLGFIVLTALTAIAKSASEMIIFRLITGLGASGVVPIALALIGDLFPFAERGRALGWLFGAMAGGMAFGSTAGVILEPLINWQGLFLATSALGGVMLIFLLPFRSMLAKRPSAQAPASIRNLLAGYWALLASLRGRRTYGYVLINAVFHSGVYTWLGLYFSLRYALGEIGIGLALLGYGVPGFLLGPPIGRIADRWGRARMIPIGLAVAGLSTTALALDLPVIGAALLVTLLSLGYDMTQPLLAGIVTDLSSNKGQAMGLNVFTLFTGFGIGSLVFSAAMTALSLEGALVSFGVVALLAGAAAVPLFRDETPRTVLASVPSGGADGARR